MTDGNNPDLRNDRLAHFVEGLIHQPAVVFFNKNKLGVATASHIEIFNVYSRIVYRSNFQNLRLAIPVGISGAQIPYGIINVFVIFVSIGKTLKI